MKHETLQKYSMTPTRVNGRALLAKCSHKPCFRWSMVTVILHCHNRCRPNSTHGCCHNFEFQSSLLLIQYNSTSISPLICFIIARLCITHKIFQHFMTTPLTPFSHAKIFLNQREIYSSRQRSKASSPILAFNLF